MIPHGILSSCKVGQTSSNCENQDCLKNWKMQNFAV